MDWTPHTIANVTTVLANHLRGLPDPGERWNRKQRDMIVDQKRDLIHLAVQILDEVRRTRAIIERIDPPAPAAS